MYFGLVIDMAHMFWTLKYLMHLILIIYLNKIISLTQVSRLPNLHQKYSYYTSTYCKIQ